MQRITVLQNPARTVLLSLGAGCILLVFSLSLTGQVSRHYPIALSNTTLYSITGCVAIAVLCLVLLARKSAYGRKLYRSVFFLAGILFASWCILAIVSQSGAILDQNAAELLFLSLESSRLLFTALILVLWNLHISLSRVSEVPQIAALTVLFAASLFALTSILGKTEILIVVFVAGAVSFGLLPIVEKRYSFNSESHYSAQAAHQALLREPKPTKSLTKTRAIFFLSRILWYLVVTVFTLISYGVFHVEPSSYVVTILAALVLLVNAFGITLLVQNKVTASFISIAIPIFIIGLYILVFQSGDLGSLNRVFVVLVVFVRHLLFYIQLPSYRNITMMNPVQYAFLERLIPVAATYLIRLFLSLGFFNFLFSDSSEHLTSLSLLLFMIISVSVFIFVLVRHIWRYFPSESPQANFADGLHQENGENDSSLHFEKTIQKIAEVTNLTPRETDVLHYLAQGYSKPYIAKVLYVSQATIKTHTNKIYRKTGVNSHDDLLDYVAKQM